MNESNSMRSELKFLLRASLASIVAAGIAYAIHKLYSLPEYLADVGGLSIFVSAFGVLYGVMISFVVLEVWNQYNHASLLIDKEAKGLEHLYRLTRYLKVLAATAKMQGAIRRYIDCVIKKEFRSLADEKKEPESDKAFLSISKAISDIKTAHGKEPVIFDHLLTHYEHLAELRTERIEESLTRVPPFLKVFMYVSSFFMAATFIVMPFQNAFYSVFTVGLLVFTISLILQLIEELDNPFFGHWNLTHEPFVKARRYMEDAK